MPRLRIHPGRPDETVHELPTGALVIGRDPENGIHIPKRSLSRHHARLEVGQDGATLTDLGSKNGTFVNGSRIASCALRGGERIRFGHIDARFEDDRAAADDAPSGPTPIRSRTGVARRPVTALISPGGGAAETVLGLRSLAPAERINGWLQVLLDFGQCLLTATSAENVCDETLSVLFESIGVERVVVLLDGGGSEALEPRAVRAAPGLAQADLTHARKLADYALQKSATVLFPEATAGDADKAWAPANGQPIRSAMVAPLTSSLRVHGALYVDRVTNAPFTPEELERFASVASQAAMALRAANLREKATANQALERSLGRFFPPALAHRAAIAPSSLLGPVERQATILCARIDGLTSAATIMPLGRTIADLRDALPALKAVVFDHGGILAHFAGETLVAAWGVPDPLESHASRALDAAIALQRTIVEVSTRIARVQPLQFRIGVHSGAVAAGNLVAAPDALYGVVGATVSLARSVCHEAEASEVLLTDATMKRSGGSHAGLSPRASRGSAGDPTLPALFRLRW